MFLLSLTPNEHPTQKPFMHDDSAACNSVPIFFLCNNHQWPTWSLQYFSGAVVLSCVWGNQLQLANQTYQNTRKHQISHKNWRQKSAQACCHWFGRLQSSWPACSIPTTTDHTICLGKAWCRLVVEQNSLLYRHHHWCCTEEQEYCRCMDSSQ